MDDYFFGINFPRAFNGGVHGEGLFPVGLAPAAGGGPAVWTQQNFETVTGVGGNFPTSVISRPGRLVAQCASATPVFSVDGGTTWTNSSTLTTSGGIGAAFEAGHYVIAGATGSGHVVWYSTDGGVTFTGGPDFAANAASIVSNGSNLMVMLLNGTIAGGNYAISTDHGVTWTQQNTFTGSAAWGSGGSIQNTAFWDGTQFVSLLMQTGTGNAQIATSGDGVHWTASAYLAFTQSITFGAGIYMGCNGIDDNVYFASTPAGIATASPVSTGLPNSPVQSLMYDGTAFYAFDSRGNAARSLTGSSWTQEQTHIPHVFGNAIDCSAFDTTNNTVVAFTGVGASAGHPFSVRAGL